MTGYDRLSEGSIIQVLLIVLCADQSDAGCRATFDLVLKTRPRTIGEHGIFAGAQLK